MPAISQFYGIVIRMYFDDKHGPHFHAEYAEYEALVSILSLQVLAGSLPPRAYKLVIEWAQAHHDELMANWKKAKARETLKRIAPLR